jgi:hypothetical protein
MIERLFVAGVFATLSFPALAQSAGPLVGTWTVVYVNDERAEGVDLPVYGPKPAGMLMFDADGHYSLQICAVGRPRFSNNDRLKGTPDEYRAAVSGCNSHWGRYEVDEGGGVIVFRIEHGLFTNWEGAVQRRPFRLANGLLRYQVPSPSTEAQKMIVVWRREATTEVSGK